MIGLITQFIVASDRRDELAGILAAASKAMPGCLSYVVATDDAHEDSLWVTEVWTDRASHAASLKLTAVQKAMAAGRPLISGIGARIATHPVADV